MVYYISQHFHWYLVLLVDGWPALSVSANVHVIIGSKSLFEPTLHWVRESFFHQTWTDMDETRNISEGPRYALTKKLWEITMRVSPTGAKLGFVFLSCNHRRLMATYPAPTLTIFNTKDENQCPVENFPISVQRIYQAPKTAKNKNGVISRGCLWWGYSSSGTLSNVGNRVGG